MKTQFVEVTNAEGGGGINWGKFMVCQFMGFEWDRPAMVVKESEGREVPLLSLTNWTEKEILVVDLQTGEGGRFTVQKKVGDHSPASWQLNEKHQIWVCPMFEPFLNWLFEQDLTQPLPLLVRFSETEAPSALYGYRRLPATKSDSKYSERGGDADLIGKLSRQKIERDRRKKRGAQRRPE